MFYKRIQEFIKCNYTELFIYLIIIYLGIIHLPYPFSGDQALFTIAAKKMASGGILYKDFWDIKQPGIFIFFYLAGSVFKFNEIGMHLFELIYWLLFTFLIIRLFNRINFFENRKINTILPLFIVGVYYSNAGISHLTQVEALINFPILFLFWILAYIDNDKDERYQFIWLLISGFLVGVILFFKLVFLPVILLLFLVFFIRTIYFKTVFKGLNYLLPIALGFLVILVPALIYYYKNNLLGSVYFNFLVLPTKVIKLDQEVNSHRLFVSLFWYTKFNFIFLILCIIGLFNLKNYTPYILLWLISALAVIIMQRTSWWSYHFQLLYAPIGIGAAKGLDYLWIKTKFLVKTKFLSGNRIITFVAFLAFIFSVQLLYVLQKSARLVKHNFAISSSDRIQYQVEIDSKLKEMAQEANFLKNQGSIKGPIFICGDPRFYILSGRDQSISIHGWSFQFFIKEQWDLFYEEFRISNTPYIFIANNYLRYISENCPDLSNLLSKEYSLYKESDFGYWFVKN